MGSRKRDKQEKRRAKVGSGKRDRKGRGRTRMGSRKKNQRKKSRPRAEREVRLGTEGETGLRAEKEVKALLGTLFLFLLGFLLSIISWCFFACFFVHFYFYFSFISCLATAYRSSKSTSSIRLFFLLIAQTVSNS